MGIRGQLWLILIFIVSLALVVVLSFYFYSQAGNLGFNLPAIPWQKKDLSYASNWKKFTTPDQKLTYSYPPDWYVFEDKYVSQYPFNPLSQSEGLANAISSMYLTDQIQNSYTNFDWFDKINNASPNQVVINDYAPISQARISKIDSGLIQSGQSYVIFKDGHLPDKIFAYLKLRSAIYQLNLQLFNDEGIKYFQQIVPTAVVNGD